MNVFLAPSAFGEVLILTFFHYDHLFVKCFAVVFIPAIIALARNGQTSIIKTVRFDNSAKGKFISQVVLSAGFSLTWGSSVSRGC